MFRLSLKRNGPDLIGMYSYVRRLLPKAFLLAALPAQGQFLSVGVKAGVPLTTAYSVGATGTVDAKAYDRHYTIGPTVEVHFPLHLSFEADALYRRNGFDYNFLGAFFGTPSFLPPSSSRSTINDWQFPLLAKYEKRLGPIRPFVDVGVVYRHVSSAGNVLMLPYSRNSAGFSVGGGATFKLLLIRLSPEVRYTHWPTPPFNNTRFVVLSTTNQADVLLGISF